LLKTGRGTSTEEAEAAALEIGVQALTFIAGDPEQMERFLALSGMEVGQVRAAARDPAFFAGLLDFLLGHEPTLLAFAAQAGLSPESVGQARDRLGGAFGVDPW
jgi:L-cystine uptake protein TcyP (sodium:dicarboxylate symporter family)